MIVYIIYDNIYPDHVLNMSLCITRQVKINQQPSVIKFDKNILRSYPFTSIIPPPNRLHLRNFSFKFFFFFHRIPTVQNPSAQSYNSSSIFQPDILDIAASKRREQFFESISDILNLDFSSRLNLENYVHSADKY